MKTSKPDRRRGMVRRLFRLALKTGIVVGVMAAVRATVGRAPDEPGNSARHNSGTGRSTPMSFDSWPAVPEAPSRRSG